jgi:hypothetical protein
MWIDNTTKKNCPEYRLISEAWALRPEVSPFYICFCQTRMPVNDDRCLPTVVIEGNTAGMSGVAELRKKMDRYLQPGSPVIFFIGIIIFRRRLKKRKKFLLDK